MRPKVRRLDTLKLVVASHNKGKVREIADLMAPFGLETVSAGDLDLPEPEETGSTFAENAEIKALAAARAADLPALADDSGLEVDALGGDPGIFAARWAETPEGRDFGVAMKRVQEAMEVSGNAERGARFVCALTLAWPDGHTETFVGTVEGEIVWPPRGDKGFGYDPIFVPEGYDITFAEMEPAAKHRISHRADAFQKMIDACFCKN